MALVCPLCPPERAFSLPFNTKDYLRHIELFHAHQPNFCITCGIGGCQRTFQKFHTFRNHISDHHSDEPKPTNQPISTTPEQEDCNITADGGHCDQDENHVELSATLSTLQTSSALFLLGLKEERKLTQTALQGVIEGVTTLTRSRLSVLYDQLCNTLSAAGISPSSIPGFSDLFDSDGPFARPFSGLETPHQQLRFYKSHFQFVEPVSVALGSRRVWKGRGHKRRCVEKMDSLVYIPCLNTLQSLLQNEGILAEVQSTHKSKSGFMEDFCDGKFFDAHPLFSVHCNALQILFYFDEVEICNPLGSKAKIHKLGMFYFTLGNVPPKFRSKLSSIQLLAIVKTTILSMYGMDAVLKPFVDDLKKLEKGVHFEVHGKRQLYHGALAVVSADNLGSLALGGFKESCTANRCCRHCLATRDTAKVKFMESDFTLRDEVSHRQQCSELEGESGRDASKLYGINRDSILNQLSYFHVCSGALLPDVMHDVLEGALQYEIKLMLRVMISEEQYFTLDNLNSRLENFELGYMESKDRPTPVNDTTLHSSGVSLKQSASQMWLFARILPLLVGDYIPDDDEHWENFLRMMDIVDRLFSSKISEDDTTYIKWLISDHHQEFSRLYPTMSVIPKMHFMVHMPRLMVQFGPLVRHWTMRFEAKHSYFKQLAQAMGNFTNLPYSLAMRHQQLCCYQGNNGMEIAGTRLIVGPGTVAISDTLQEELKFSVSSAYNARWVKVDGVEYKCDAGVVCGMEHDLPTVGQISSLFVINSANIYLKVKLFSSLYLEHFRVYTLHTLKSEALISVDNLLHPHPIHIRTTSAVPHQHIILPCYINS